MNVNISLSCLCYESTEVCGFGTYARSVCLRGVLDRYSLSPRAEIEVFIALFSIRESLETDVLVFSSLIDLSQWYGSAHHAIVTKASDSFHGVADRSPAILGDPVRALIAIGLRTLDDILQMLLAIRNVFQKLHNR